MIRAMFLYFESLIEAVLPVVFGLTVLVAMILLVWWGYEQLHRRATR